MTPFGWLVVALFVGLAFVAARFVLARRTAGSAPAASIHARATSGADVVVRDLYLHPIKGCAPVRVDQALVVRTGLQFDREWLIVRETTKAGAAAAMMTQRELPCIKLIRVTIESNAATSTTATGATATSAAATARVLRLAAPGMEDALELPIAVPLLKSAVAPSDTEPGRGELRQVKLARLTVTAIDEGDAVAEWITTFVRRTLRARRLKAAASAAANSSTTPSSKGDAKGDAKGGDSADGGGDDDDESKWSLRLVRLYEPRALADDPMHGRLIKDDEHSAFNDWSPFHITSAHSLDALNALLPIPPIPMTRFRPNIVIGSRVLTAEAVDQMRPAAPPLPAYAEDQFQSLTVGGVGFHQLKPTGRCTVPSVTEQGELPPRSAGPLEPYTTLNRIRRSRYAHLTPQEYGEKMFFGFNAAHEQWSNLEAAAAGGTPFVPVVLRVGDPVVVRSTRPPINFFPAN